MIVAQVLLRTAALLLFVVASSAPSDRLKTPAATAPLVFEPSPETLRLPASQPMQIPQYVAFGQVWLRMQQHWGSVEVEVCSPSQLVQVQPPELLTQVEYVPVSGQ